eukprot:CAMPEP_0170470826 /NCGR_PEP_ID=MMETSP0123-20130129/13186_1 /TAXON_ID=182087 /ORGANISM="Favella ehrenbergii, Strain Fehren 1" /LENGTH=125 /DNA_ID=CAMNT_0010738143 /DNA_START=695 /DNA_END=1072 /DNA_ORIENTATION=+
MAMGQSGLGIVSPVRSCGEVMQEELFEEVEEQRMVAGLLMFITKVISFAFALLLKLHPDVNVVLDEQPREIYIDHGYESTGESRLLAGLQQGKLFACCGRRSKHSSSCLNSEKAICKGKKNKGWT